MRVGLYARVSTADKGQSADVQLDRLRDYCKAKGWQIVAVYQEEVTGTGKVVREMFNNLMEDARLRKFDLLLVWKFDRFSREGAYKSIEHIQKLNSYGVKFESLTEPFLATTGSFGEQVLIPLMAWMSQQESIRISERVRAGILRKKQKCINLGVKFKWGRRDYSNEIIEQIKQLKINNNSIRQIANALNLSVGGVHKTLKRLEQLETEENPKNLS